MRYGYVGKHISYRQKPDAHTALVERKEGRELWFDKIEYYRE
jgi:hypothetical protein